MKKLENINFTDYQFDSLGGQWIYTPKKYFKKYNFDGTLKNNNE